MSLWTLNTPPRWVQNAVATVKGWAHPTTNELLVAIRNLTTKAGAADILAVSLNAEEYLQGDELSVTVRFNEKVDVSAGASLVLSWDGLAGDITLYAAAQSNSNLIVFAYESDLTTLATIPMEAGTLEMAAQSLVGTIKDTGTAVDSNKAISGAIALTLGEIEVA